jgi:hypothetical protein
MNRILPFVLLAPGVFVAPAHAQQASPAFVVSTCGTLPAGVVYAAGQYGILTMDVTGKLCDSATGGGGGGGAVTIASGGVASGAYSAGSVSAGAYVAGSYASGAIPDIGGAITAAQSGAAESNHVLKASAGNLYNAYATSTVAGYLMIFNSTSAPADGAVTPQDCIPSSLTQAGIYAASINYNPGPIEPFTIGITVVWSSTGCFTKTASATAFIHGVVK